jgi:hypothetical protein
MKQFFSKQTIILLLALAVFLTLSVLLSTSVISKAGISPTQYGNDFTVFYAAAKNLFYFADPYNHPIAEKTPYLYLPLFSLIIIPLALLPLAKASAIWYWLNILFILLLLCILTNAVSSKKIEKLPIAILLFLLTSRLILDNLLWGQVNILVTLLISFWFLAEQKSYKWLGNIALAIAISIKITPILLAFYIFLKGRFQELIRLSICLFMLTLISLIPLGSKSPSLLKGWFSRTILNGEGFNWAYAGNQSLKGMLERFLSPSNTESKYYPKVNFFNLSAKEVGVIFFFITLTLIIYFSYSVLKKRQKSKKFLISEVGAVCTLMLLLSNLSWKAHFILLILPLAILLKVALFGKQFSAISKLILLFFFILTVFTVQPIIGQKFHQWFETHSYYCLITLVIFPICLKSGDQEKL